MHHYYRGVFDDLLAFDPIESVRAVLLAILYLFLPSAHCLFVIVSLSTFFGADGAAPKSLWLQTSRR